MLKSCKLLVVKDHFIIYISSNTSNNIKLYQNMDAYCIFTLSSPGLKYHLYCQAPWILYCKKKIVKKNK